MKTHKKTTGEYLQLSSGRGPEECRRAAALLCERIVLEGKERNLSVSLLESRPGYKPRTYFSALLLIEGERARDFTRGWAGVILWINPSPFRPRHRRKNWYVSVERPGLLPGQIAAEAGERPALNQADLRFETMGASGPGGQHANKNAVGVRITHVPTGLKAQSRTERSLTMNRQKALRRLGELLMNEERNRQEREKGAKREQHDRITRGAPIRIFQGPEFQPVA